jgi:monoamine oxidase
LPFELDPAERGRDASDLEEAAIETALPGFRRLRGQYHRACHADDWGQARAIGTRYAELRSQPSLGGGLLQDLSWPEFLDTKLSEEAVKFIRATDGYDNYNTNGNAAESADRMFRVPPDGAFMTLAGGMQSLPTTLHEMFSAAGGATFLQHRLHRIEQTSAASAEPAFRLAFHSREGSGEGGERPVTVYARRVVLAMPPQAAWQIHSNRPVLGETAGNGVGTVKGIPALKIFLAYPNPWWEQAGVTVGRSTTDLPLRQAWYLPGGQAGAAIMAAYPAGAAVRYWDRYLPGQHVGVVPLGPSERGRAVGSAAAMAANAHRMLGEMHGVTEAPEPTAVAWQDWGEAAWHARRPGHSPQDAGSLLAPPGPLHLVSDCWTSSPGSVDGTLRAAELVLRQHLGCGVPEWLAGKDDWE